MVAVMPDRSPAAPRRADFEFPNNFVASNLKGVPGLQNDTFSGIGSRGAGGPREGSVHVAEVACDPGARASPSKAFRPVDNSPR